ncbi:hypothetical protein FN846DRAFT_118349 [Sphaerosporella brunnea]|uniref:Ubiquitin-like protease family profile domain-containing protein n=1 Tax=Sphaerosporella brunnea TaxID=1250544 RepID=A0A5J5ERD4_9PEZI|nr:hypothetical protein FN846DRAFT_118349 [Sphaerosporella brunnea]
MGSSLSKSATHGSGVSSGRITKSVQRPKESAKSHLERAIERARRAQGGETEQAQLKAMLQLISREPEKEFRRLDEVRKRQNEIAEQVARLRREVIAPLRGKLLNQYQKILTDVTKDVMEHNNKTYKVRSYKLVKGTNSLTTTVLARVLGIMDGGWLDDEAINYYLNLIQERENEEKPRILIFTTFFYESLSRGGYDRVAKYGLKRGVTPEDVLKLDFLMLPLHLGSNHWALGVINLKLERFEVYDSIMPKNGPSQKIYDSMRAYMVGLSKATGKKIDLSRWINYWDPRAPQQANGFDCGIFAAKTMEVYARRGKVNFSSTNINHQRALMAVELYNGELVDYENNEHLAE